MNISLTPELEKYVSEQVNSGLYNSASEVILEGLRLLQKRDELQAIQLNELRQQIQLGIESGEPQPLALQDIIERGRARYAQRHQASN